jgi:hypothetical protein
MSCAQGSPDSEPGQRARGLAAQALASPTQASVRTGPAGIPVRGCVDVRAHTREASEPRAYRSCAPLPTALPPPGPPSQFREFMSNISTTRGRQDMRFCVCGSPRGDLSHIAGLTLGRSRSDFSGANQRAQEPYMWGVGLTQQIA